MIKTPLVLGFRGDEILPSYVGIILNHDKDPYQPTSIMESRRGLFVAHVTKKQGTLDP